MFVRLLPLPDCGVCVGTNKTRDGWYHTIPTIHNAAKDYAATAQDRDATVEHDEQSSTTMTTGLQ